MNSAVYFHAIVTAMHALVWPGRNARNIGAITDNIAGLR